MEGMQLVGTIIGSSIPGVVLGFLLGRRKANAEASNTEAKTTRELLDAFSDTLKMVREGEERHTELSKKLTERDLLIAELQSTVAAKDSAILSMGHRLSTIPAKVSSLAERVTEVVEQLKEVVLAMNAKEANGGTTHE